MAQSIKMPALGESVTEGTVTAWLKKVGDTVELDEPIVEVATDKVDSEVPSPIAGVLLEILVQEDDTVAVGTEIARIGAANSVTVTQPVASPPDSGSHVEVKMPALGESVTEGTVTAWLKKVGDRVELDEALVEVATDKVDSEVPSPAAGFLTEVKVEEDETVTVGTVIAVISATLNVPVSPTSAPTPAFSATPAPLPPAPAWANAPASLPAPQDAQAVLDTLATTAAETGRKIFTAKPSVTVSSYVTPLVRKLAREKGVDLGKVSGSGIGGRIRKEDILAAVVIAPTSSPARSYAAIANPLRGTTVKMSRLRQTIARRMVGSLQTAAQLTTVIEVDVTRIAALRAESKSAFEQIHGARLTFLPFFVKAATDALIEHPVINATINDNEVTYFDHENIGIAVDAPKGLMVPVIKNAGTLDLAGIAKSISTLATKARNSTITPDELSGSTFTITNTGSGGALFDTPVINMPEVAILGVGAIVKRAVVIRDGEGNDAIAIRSMVYLSLSYDHRIVDGADGARYLQSVKKRLEAAEFDADLGLSS